jgi:hypothetical protein
MSEPILTINLLCFEVTIHVKRTADNSVTNKFVNDPNIYFMRRFKNPVMNYGKHEDGRLQGCCTV